MANLIGFDKKREDIQFKGHSKLSINFMSNYLYVEPENEECKLISASFTWNYVMKKNLLFVFAEFDFLDFCLEFKTEQICKKIFDYLVSGKKDDTEHTSPVLINDSFIKPILQKITDNPGLNSALIEVIGKWHQFLDGGEKEIYSNLMKEYGVYDTILGAITIPVMHRNELNFEEKKRNRSVLVQMRNRKRKFCRIKKEENFADENELQTKNSPLIYSETVPSTLFQLTHVPRSYHRKLLVFTSDQMDSFHVFKSILKTGKFKCIKCEKKAFIDVNDNDEICVKMESKKHLCKPSKQFPETSTKIKLIQKPEYELFENCPGKVNKKLVVFDSGDRSLCYEYSWSNKTSKFFCRDCCNKKIVYSNLSKANIRNEGTGKEYVEIYVDHQCQKRKYQPEKYAPIYDYVLKPDFEIQKFNKSEKQHQRLIIFDPSDRTKCYYYYYVFSIKKFVCCSCNRNQRKKRKFVTATLNKNSENEEYIILSNAKHVCEMRSTDSIKKIILHQPQDFDIVNETKIFLFEKSGREKGYLFSKQRILYSCLGCDSRRMSKKENQVVSVVYGKLIKSEETGEYSFEMKPDQTHSCKPRPYQPEQYENVPKTYEFFYYRLKHEPRTVKLAIQLPKNNQLCYTFVYEKQNNCFICIECRKMKKRYSLKLQKDADGKEFFNHNVKKHICEPIKVSSIPKCDILKESGIELELKQKLIINESKIIKSPNFELRPNKNGILNRKLIILLPNDKTLCYEFCYYVVKQIFYCIKCKTKKTCVSAKLHENGEENGEESFIVMGKNEHICKPIKVLSIPKSDILKVSGIKIQSNPRRMPKFDENKIIKSPNFELRPNRNGVPERKVIIFCSKDKTLCYDFFYHNKKQLFICTKCSMLKTYVSAKLQKNDDEENKEESFIVMGRNEHICEPRQYKPF